MLENHGSGWRWLENLFFLKIRSNVAELGWITRGRLNPGTPWHHSRSSWDTAESWLHFDPVRMQENRQPSKFESLCWHSESDSERGRAWYWEKALFPRAQRVVRFPSPCYQVALETQVWFIESFHFRPLGCLILERWDCHQIWLMCPSSVSLGWRNWQW